MDKQEKHSQSSQQIPESSSSAYTSHHQDNTVPLQNSRQRSTLATSVSADQAAASAWAAAKDERSRQLQERQQSSAHYRTLPGSSSSRQPSPTVPSSGFAYPLYPHSSSGRPPVHPAQFPDGTHREESKSRQMMMTMTAPIPPGGGSMPFMPYYPHDAGSSGSSSGSGMMYNHQQQPPSSSSSSSQDLQQHGASMHQPVQSWPPSQPGLHAGHGHLAATMYAASPSGLIGKQPMTHDPVAYTVHHYPGADPHPIQHAAPQVIQPPVVGQQQEQQQQEQQPSSIPLRNWPWAEGPGGPSRMAQSSSHPVQPGQSTQLPSLQTRLRSISDAPPPSQGFYGQNPAFMLSSPHGSAGSSGAAGSAGVVRSGSLNPVDHMGRKRSLSSVTRAGSSGSGSSSMMGVGMGMGVPMDLSSSAYYDGVSMVSPVMMRSRGSSGAGTTRRAKFKRSRTGCKVCRMRKIRCSEDGQPCKQCRIGDRQCYYDPVPTPRRRTPKDKSNVAAATPLTALVSMSTPAAMAAGAYGISKIASAAKSDPPSGPSSAEQYLINLDDEEGDEAYGSGSNPEMHSRSVSVESPSSAAIDMTAGLSQQSGTKHHSPHLLSARHEQLGAAGRGAWHSPSGMPMLGMGIHSPSMRSGNSGLGTVLPSALPGPHHLLGASSSVSTRPLDHTQQGQQRHPDQPAHHQSWSQPLASGIPSDVYHAESHEYTGQSILPAFPSGPGEGSTSIPSGGGSLSNAPTPNGANSSGTLYNDQYVGPARLFDSRGHLDYSPTYDPYS